MTHYCHLASYFAGVDSSCSVAVNVKKPAVRRAFGRGCLERNPGFINQNKEITMVNSIALMFACAAVFVLACGNLWLQVRSKRSKRK